MIKFRILEALKSVFLLATTIVANNVFSILFPKMFIYFRCVVFGLDGGN